MPKKSKRLHSTAKKTVIIMAAIVIITGWLVSPFSPLPNPRWQEPKKLISKNGVLEVNLHAKKSTVTIGGKQVDARVYNDKYLGDTWVVKGGDTLKVHLKNNLDQPTNLHFHGSHVSPKGHSDNVLISINPGETFEYEYKLPKNHPPGLYWYHPHVHPFVGDQVGDGMAGAIIVQGDIDDVPSLKGIKEKQIILTTQGSASAGNLVRLVNNQINPTLYVQPFETVRLEFFNMSADDFYNLAIPGTKLQVISRDGNILSEVDIVDSELLAPGDRIQILFQAGLPKEFEVKSLFYDQGFMKYPEVSFMKIKVQGLPVVKKELPQTLKPHEDFRKADIDRVRTLTFSMGGTKENTTFLLDGKEFDPNVISQIMTLGTIEEWHLVNNSTEAHPFHIHINPFQVISVDGKPIDRKGYDDTFPIPPGSTVVMRTKYKDFDGKYVLHCHILYHEDHGMMQVVEVVKPGTSPASHNGLPEREGHLHHTLN